MKFTINRESLLPALQQASGVVEKRQTMPILGNVLLTINNNNISVTATDLEVQVVSTMPIDNTSNELVGLSITVPAIKLLSIVKALPKGADIRFKLNDKQKLIVSSGKSRFTLATIPADDYPKFLTSGINGSIDLKPSELLNALNKTSFCMANQDIRYYLNGLYITRENGIVKFIGSDGHRLGIYTCDSEYNSEDMSMIIPRKAVGELIKLIGSIKASDDILHSTMLLQYSRDCIHIELDNIQFTAKLIDSKYPSFSKVFERSLMPDITVNKEVLKQAISRVMILSNEKFRGIEFKVNGSELTIDTNNPEHEEANEVVDIKYGGAPFDMAFNAQYMLEAATKTDTDDVIIQMAENSSCCFVIENKESNYVFIVMPMRL